MNYWLIYSTDFMNHFVPALAWCVALGIPAVVVGVSPLGRGILSSFRERQRANDLSAGIVDELAALNASLREVTERLDATEHHLRGLKSTVARPVLGEPVKQPLS